MITIHRAAAIVTMNDRQPMADAVAVRGDRIVAVGGFDDVVAAIGTETYGWTGPCRTVSCCPG
jgi:predicted amidohydrolase YtcJ